MAKDRYSPGILQGFGDRLGLLKHSDPGLRKYWVVSPSSVRQPLRDDSQLPRHPASKTVQLVSSPPLSSETAVVTIETG